MSIIVLEGNIGVTKTTIGNTITEKLKQMSSMYTQTTYQIDNKIFKFVFIPEDLNPEKLTEFYTDPTKNSFEFQMYMLRKAADNYIKAKEYSDHGFLVMLDRNFIGYTVFLKTLYRQKCLTENQYQYLINEVKKINPVYEKIIHIQDLPFACLKRIKNRNRPYEQDITIDYLLEIDIIYNNELSTCNNVQSLYVSEISAESVFKDLIVPYMNKSIEVITT
jgi:deoxyadenosine/deoxycytidine kinase